MTRNIIRLLLLILLLQGRVAAEQTIDLLVLDAPFNSHGYPSMQQSLRLTTSFYEAGHYLIEESLSDRPANIRFAALAGFDLLSLWLPLGTSWLHEEWHRAILTQRDIASENEIYKLRFSDIIRVYGIRDEDLIRLKAEHPADLVRLHAAGFEAQTELNRALERNDFFDERDHFNVLILWFNTLNTIVYFHNCNGSRADRPTNEVLADETTDILARDFAGLDCTAWTYDLHRPNEPYNARGVHPSGVGIDRYIKYSDLNDAEQDFLKQQSNLSLLNLIDPFLYGRRYFEARPGKENSFNWNAAVRHMLTPFGYTIDFDLLIKTSHNFTFTLHNYFNNQHYFPGLELMLYSAPTMISGLALKVSGGITLWKQPEALSFYTDQANTGGRLVLRTDLQVSKRFNPYLELEMKSPGWVAGNSYLDSNTSFRAGITYILQ